MPYVWQDNDEFFTHNGVTIYHIYKDDEASQGVRYFWYATTSHGSDNATGENGEFDVRELKAAEGRPIDEMGVVTGDYSTIHAIIRAAIESGELPKEEVSEWVESEEDGKE